ncbi:MAG: ABC transporter permease [Thermodesulfobacteriota bacterium]
MFENSLIIKPPKGYLRVDFKELWKYRELLFFLVWRDIKVRYKQTVVGAGWAIIQPVFQMIVFTVFFGKIAKVPSDDLPYPIFSYSGLLLWTYFSSALSGSSNSLIGSSNLISKVYFPRLIIPLSSSLAPIVDYLIALTILFFMMVFYGIYPDYKIIFFPVVLTLTFFASTGISLWLSAMNVKFRDVKYVLPFFVQLLMFLTPVIYPVSFIPDKFVWLLYLNPLAALVDVHRAVLLGYNDINFVLLSISIVVNLIIFITGIRYFRKTESFFADII